nr:enteric beta-defensin-like [Microcebus murinus]
MPPWKRIKSEPDVILGLLPSGEKPSLAPSCASLLRRTRHGLSASAMRVRDLFFTLPFLSLLLASGFFAKGLFPLSCLEDAGFCFPFRCYRDWEEIGRCFLPRQKCCRRLK